MLEYSGSVIYNSKLDIMRKNARQYSHMQESRWWD